MSSIAADSVLRNILTVCNMIHADVLMLTDVTADTELIFAGVAQIQPTARVVGRDVNALHRHVDMLAEAAAHELAIRPAVIGASATTPPAVSGASVIVRPAVSGASATIHPAVSGVSTTNEALCSIIRFQNNSSN